MSKNQDKLLALRHTAEHVLHQAMTDLYPGLKRAMGPATNEGFYFDFDYSQKISESDFPKIEKQMQKIIKADLPLIKEQISYAKAKKMFKDNPYKLDWIKKIESKNEPCTIYWTGKPGSKSADPDLCSGPHLKSTGEVKAFKLLSVAGAYWHGDEKNKMLTRIYGTAFFDQKELDKHLKNLKQAKKRDHRLIGKKLKLFLFDQKVGQGLPMYLPKGAMLRHLLIEFALKTYLEKGYQLVSTPHIGSEKLWKKSGHIGFYDDSMYGPLKVEGQKYRLKPMNCPFHVVMYNSDIRSYKDLPIRWTEMGTVYRYEKSGEIHGLVRPRGFTQDDAHIICTQKQLKQEIKAALDLTKYMYQTLGMTDLIFKLSTRDPETPQKYVGQHKDWQKAESALKQVLLESGHQDFELDVGGAAFYAPKIDIDALDSMNRRWQLSTIQIDFNLPARFNMSYIDQKGKSITPFMIHRALLGSIERFLGVYIEHTNGQFPVWLSPIQVKVLPIANQHLKYAKTIISELKKAGIRVELDDQKATIQDKIRRAHQEKVPYMLIIGDQEIKLKKIMVRNRQGQSKGPLSLDKFIKNLKQEIDQKVID